MQTEDVALPFSFTIVVDFLGSLEIILMVPLFLPADAGTNLTVAVHELPLDNVAQLWV